MQATQPYDVTHSELSIPSYPEGGEVSSRGLIHRLLRQVLGVDTKIDWQTLRVTLCRLILAASLTLSQSILWFTKQLAWQSSIA